MRTACSLPYGGVSLTDTSDRDPLDRDPPWIEIPPGQRPLEQRHPWTDTLLDRDPPMDRQTPVKTLPSHLWAVISNVENRPYLLFFAIQFHVSVIHV